VSKRLSDGPLEITRIQTLGLGGGPLAGGRGGVPVEHVAPRPAGHGHQAAFAATGRQPAVGGGVPKHVGMEATDTCRLGSPAEGECRAS
jgi:hypothetical protein